ncbi:OmpA family protein [Myxococcaceae bacterium GXIMD 01537]
MAFNLIEAARSQFSGDLIQRISGNLGEDPGAVERVMPGTIASVAGSVVEQGSTEAGAGRLLSQLNEGGYTGPGAGQESIQDQGERGKGMLSGLFGDKLGGVTTALTRFGGLKSEGSTSKLLAIAGPMVMGLIGRQVRDNRLNASGLMQMLGGQRSAIAAALPAGLGAVLGFGGQRVVEGARGAQPARPVSREVTHVRTPAQQEHRRSMSWALPLALLALLVVGWLLLRGRKEAPQTPQATVNEPVSQAPDEAVGGAGTAGTAAAPPRVTTPQQLNQAFSQPTPQGFILENVAFQAGSAQLTPASSAAVGQLAAQLRQNPNARIRIEGHTDNAGDPSANRQLSQQRAEAVRTSLVKDGIAAGRVDAAGLGADEPVAPNDSETGRAQNRRIEVQVLNP